MPVPVADNISVGTSGLGLLVLILIMLAILWLVRHF